MSYPGIIVAFVFAQNVVLSRLLGLCPLVAVTRSPESAVVTGAGLLFVGSLSGIATWAVSHLILLPLGLGSLQTAVFMLVVAGVARFAEGLAAAVSPALAAVLAAHVEHTMTSSAVLGICLVAVSAGYGVMQSFVAALAGVAGFLLAAVVLASIEEKLSLEWVPRPLRGAPIALISAGILALAFMAFDGIAG
jgi:Na+-translocating ferredoxin:NAD+ oxidoreductase subunit A